MRFFSSRDSARENSSLSPSANSFAEGVLIAFGEVQALAFAEVSKAFMISLTY